MTVWLTGCVDAWSIQRVTRGTLADGNGARRTQTPRAGAPLLGAPALQHVQLLLASTRTRVALRWTP
jgi:hypothetical protein